MNDSYLSHIFGPVPSRRLGYSLGVDLMPYKVCTFDCIYCQLGRTTNKTADITEYIPAEEIISELGKRIKSNCKIDYITLSGSGEPTLHSRIGEIIRAVKKLTDKPIAVLTNGSLLWKEEVKEALMSADVVIPSLDAGNEKLFKLINRPHESLSFDLVVSGIKNFISEFKGETWLEVFLLEGESTEHEHLLELSKIAEYLNPAKIQLNTIARPPCEEYAKGVPASKMKEICNSFKGNVEAVSDFEVPEGEKRFAADKDIVLNLLARRPCTARDISESIEVSYNELLKMLEHLCAEGKVSTMKNDGQLFYLIKKS